MVFDETKEKESKVRHAAVGAPTHFYAELCGNLAELICQESERH
jgi:hypothetical protein